MKRIEMTKYAFNMTHVFYIPGVKQTWQRQGTLIIWNDIIICGTFNETLMKGEDECTKVKGHQRYNIGRIKIWSGYGLEMGFPTFVCPWAHVPFFFKGRGSTCHFPQGWRVPVFKFMRHIESNACLNLFNFYAPSLI